MKMQEEIRYLYVHFTGEKPHGGSEGSHPWGFSEGRARSPGKAARPGMSWTGMRQVKLSTGENDKNMNYIKCSNSRKLGLGDTVGL